MNKKLISIIIIIVISLISINLISYRMDSKTNINTATYDELVNLPFVSDKKAKYILEYRNHNRIDSLEELDDVKYIGEITIQAIKDKIIIK